MFAPPNYPSLNWFDGGLRENGWLHRLEKSNPSPEIRYSPALLRRLGGFGIKAGSALRAALPAGAVVREFYFRCGGEMMVAGSARTVRTFAQNTRLCWGHIPYPRVGFTPFSTPFIRGHFLNSSARRRSRGAKPSPLARKCGGAARVGGQRFVWNCFPVAAVSPAAAGGFVRRVVERSGTAWR